ncbi:MAG: sugar diacid recognition domain-containing protein [Treponemataceae bacterium]
MSKNYQLTKQLATRIVADIKTAANADANVIGENGLILASFDASRVGTIHEGGKRIMNGEVDEIAISIDMAATMQGTRPGYNGIVKIDGQRVAVIGIRGDPETVKPIQKLAELTLREELRRESEIRHEREIVRSMEEKIMDIAERMKVLALNGSIQAAKIGERGQSFKIVVAEMRKLAEQINEVITHIKL